MTRIGTYTPETARLIHDVVSYLRNSGFVVQRPGRGEQFVPPDAPIYVRNDTGEEIPAFGCLQTDGTVEDSGQNYVKVVKPVDAYAISGGYLFNGIAPIEIGGYGVAHDGPLVRMLTEGSTITSGDRWAPQVGSFAVAPDVCGIILAVGADDIETNVMRGEIIGPPPVIHFQSPSGGIAARSTLTMGSASCDIFVSSSSGVLSDSTQNKTIYNMASSAFGNSTHGVAALNEAGLWVAIVEDCGA